MRTLLSQSRVVPLWGFIVLISVSSFLILVIVLLICRYCARRRHGSDLESLPDGETTRRVTVRRGRIVPSSHYMSLTGSRFGLGAFVPPEDRENTNLSRSGARSKSPFEWWNAVTDRSQSRQSEVLQIKGLPLVPRVVQTSETTIAGQQPLKERPSPIRRPASFETMSKEPPAYPGPVKPSPSLSKPSRNTNFSRAFGTRSALMPPSVASSLPRIAETSPHHSIVSRQSKNSQFSGKDWTSPSPHYSTLSRHSKQSFWTDKTDSSITISELGAMTPRSPLSPLGFQNSESISNVELSTTMTSSSLNEPPESRTITTRQSSHPRTQRPAQNCTSGNRARSLPRSPRPKDDPPFERRVCNAAPRATSEIKSPQGPRHRHSSSNVSVKRNSFYRGPSTQEDVAGQSSNISLSALPQISRTEETSQRVYGESRKDFQPIRRKIGKGNVLRKKSLQRAERESRFR